MDEKSDSCGDGPTETVLLQLGSDDPGLLSTTRAKQHKPFGR